ncbi:MAG: hypothetical protein LCH43_09415 [Actinobacteria bacterium]|nr:hypothetical protein [Actinomycetota bacterium]
MTKDIPNTPDLQTEPVMDGAMDHEGPPPMTDSDGNTVDLSSPSEEELTEDEPGAAGLDAMDDAGGPEAD